MSDLVERLRRRADIMEALGDTTVEPQGSWVLEAQLTLTQGAKDNAEAAARIEALEKENAELRADCKRKDELLTAAVDDYNDARGLALEEAAKIAETCDVHSLLWRDSIATAIRRIKPSEAEGREDE